MPVLNQSELQLNFTSFDSKKVPPAHTLRPPSLTPTPSPTPTPTHTPTHTLYPNLGTGASQSPTPSHTPTHTHSPAHTLCIQILGTGASHTGPATSAYQR